MPRPKAFLSPSSNIMAPRRPLLSAAGAAVLLGAFVAPASAIPGEFESPCIESSENMLAEMRVGGQTQEARPNGGGRGPRLAHPRIWRAGAVGRHVVTRDCLKSP